MLPYDNAFYRDRKKVWLLPTGTKEGSFTATRCVVMKINCVSVDFKAQRERERALVTSDQTLYRQNHTEEEFTRCFDHME